jgi:hypothetical protein
MGGYGEVGTVRCPVVIIRLAVVRENNEGGGGGVSEEELQERVMVGFVMGRKRDSGWQDGWEDGEAGRMDRLGGWRGREDGLIESCVS